MDSFLKEEKNELEKNELENTELRDAGIENADSENVNVYSQEIDLVDVISENDTKLSAEDEMRMAYQDNIQSSHVEESKSEAPNSSVAIAFILCAFVVLIGLCVFVVVSLTKGVITKDKQDQEYHSKMENPWDEIFGEGKENKTDKEITDLPEDFFANQQYESQNDDWKKSFQNHAPKTIKGPYFEEFVNCIDENVSYKIRREFEETTNSSDNLLIRVSYIQLEGNLPNLDYLNETLKNAAEQYYQAYGETADKEFTYQGRQIVTGAYVTYNDEEKISVIIMDEMENEGSHSSNISCYNINLVTGTILDNSQILQLKPSFAKEFEKRNDKQNGKVEAAFSPYTDQQIVEMIMDAKTGIVFYTPIGLEVGYKYNNSMGSGWLTISLSEYQEYLSKM